jgi:mannose-6-phosphate isomerase-like protein (cupin superfamily)
MNAISRRDLCMALSSLVPIASVAIQAKPLPEPEKSRTLSKSKVFSLDQVDVTTNANGSKRWNVLQGMLATGESIALHESLQPAGIAPNPPHTIQHSEIILVQDGTLLFEHDGRSEKASAGGVIFVAFGTKHAARNVGDSPARYLVISVGGDTK